VIQRERKNTGGEKNPAVATRSLLERRRKFTTKRQKAKVNMKGTMGKQIDGHLTLGRSTVQH